MEDKKLLTVFVFVLFSTVESQLNETNNTIQCVDGKNCQLSGNETELKENSLDILKNNGVKMDNDEKSKNITEGMVQKKTGRSNKPTRMDDVSMEDDEDDRQILLSSSSANNNKINDTWKNSSVCFDRGKTYNVGETFEKGCDESCKCLKNDQIFCTPICMPPYFKKGHTIKNPSTCTEKQIDSNPCCVALICENDITNTEKVDEDCMYKNESYTRGATFKDGCESICTCGYDSKITCKPRCAPVNNTTESCVAVPDPNDVCCTMVLCDVEEHDHSNKVAITEEIPTSVSSSTMDKQIISAILLNNNTVKLNLSANVNCNIQMSTNGIDWKYVRCTDDNQITGLSPGKKYHFKLNGTASNIAEITIPESHLMKTNHCQYKGNTYNIGDEFHDGCDAYCVCEKNGVECATIECPTDFGLDVLDPQCLEWETHPPDFVAKAPNCCPDKVRCKDNGSCMYKNENFPNWSEIPLNVSGCEQRCYCETGNVTCQQICSPVSATPPPHLPCSPNEATLTSLPGEGCCVAWVCPNNGHNIGKDEDEKNNIIKKLIDKKPIIRNNNNNNNTKDHYEKNNTTKNNNNNNLPTSYLGPFSPQYIIAKKNHTNALSSSTSTSLEDGLLKPFINNNENIEYDNKNKITTKKIPPHPFHHHHPENEDFVEEDAEEGEGDNMDDYFNSYLSKETKYNSKEDDEIIKQQQNKNKHKDVHEHIEDEIPSFNNYFNNNNHNNYHSRYPQQSIYQNEYQNQHHHQIIENTANNDEKPMIIVDHHKNTLTQNPYNFLYNNYRHPPPPPPNPPSNTLMTHHFNRTNQGYGEEDLLSHYPGIRQNENEITVISLDAIDETTVRLVFLVPAFLVGLHGQVELRYTSDSRNMEISTWEQQILVPPNDLITTRELEFTLNELQPNTTYKIKISLNMRELESNPASEILTVKTLPRGSLNTTQAPIIPIEAELRAIETNSTWTKLSWRTFSDLEYQFIDGIQLRYKELDDKVYAATPLIHRSVTGYVIENLKPDTVYEIGIYFIPFPGQTTELQAHDTIQIRTALENDPYKFEITLEVHHLKSQSVELNWSGVPYPEDKYVNIFRAIYQSDASREDSNTFKVAKRDLPQNTMIQDLKPDTRYHIWLEAYLTNGRIKKSNVIEFTTKSGTPVQSDAKQGKLEGVPLVESNNYYGPLIGVSIIAVLAIISTTVLTLILVRKHGTLKAPITTPINRKTNNGTSIAAYDNPSYKTCESDRNGFNGNSIAMNVFTRTENGKEA